MKTPSFSTVVLGDLHGRRDLLLRALRDLGLTDHTGRWSGGSRRLIQLGDVIDRGQEPLGAMDELMRLQTEASEAGGEVLCLVGNHEAVALRAAAGDHHYRLNWTHNGGGTNWVEWMGRRGAAADERDLPYPEEFYSLFSPHARYGRWIRSHRMAVKLGEYVVVHAGWSPEGPPSVEEANDLWDATPEEPVAFLAAARRHDHPLSDDAGLLWSRNQPEAEIAAVCERLGCRGLIAGHTITRGFKTSCGGRLVQIDVGMTLFGAWAALGVDDAGRLWALMEGRQPQLLQGDGLIPLPQAEAYVPAAAAEPRYEPGSLVRLYRAGDGSLALYFLVRGLGSIFGGPGYEGRVITRNPKGWSWRSSTWPAERIDKYGHPAKTDEVPGEMITDD